MQRAGVPEAELPPAPRPPAWLAWVWRAWHRLRHDRPWYGGGMGPAVPGRIPWTAARAWAEHHAMTRAEFALLLQGLDAMDEAFLEHWAARQARGQAAPPDDKLARWDGMEEGA